MAIILANDGLAQGAIAALEAKGHEVDTAKYEGEALLARLKEVDALIVRSATKVRAPQIEAAAAGKRLKLIIRAGVGLDNIDVADCEAKGIKVRNTPEASSNAVAELAMGQIFCLARHIHRANRSMAQGAWNKKAYAGTEVAGKTLGIIGFGRIGICLAEKAKALGMQVIYYKRSTRVEGWEYRDLPELIQEADYISLNTPGTDKPILGKEEIAQMKDGVYIVNLARGGVIDETALLEGIESGKIAGAALDCFSKEPLENEAIMHCDRLSLTPHIGAATKEAQDRIGEQIVSLVLEEWS